MASVEKTYRSAGRRFRLLRPLVALFLALALVALPSWYLVGFVSAQTVVTSDRHMGFFGNHEQTMTVSVPADSFVAAYLVRKGEQVKVGQPLLTLDVDLIAKLQDQISDETAALVFERRCLLQPDEYDGITLSDFDSLDELSQLLGMALQACRLVAQDFGNDLAQVEAERDQLLTEREALLLKQSALVSDGAGALDAGTLANALELQLRMNNIDLERNTFALTVRELQTQANQQKRDRLLQIAEEIEANTIRLDQLAGLIAVPQITAPINGKIQRIRMLPTQTRLLQDTAAIQILPDVGDRFDLRLTLDQPALERLAVETVVVLELDEPNRGRRQIDALIIGVNPRQPVQQDQFDVVLSLQVDGLEDLRKGALQPLLEGAVAQVAVSRPEVGFWPTTTQILQRNCQRLNLSLCGTASRATLDLKG